MITIITSKEEQIENEKITIWRIDKNNGSILININKLLDKKILACYWQDESQKFLIVEYNDHNNVDLIAIISKEGQVIRKGIRSVEEYLNKHGMFIINISGYGLGSEAPIHDLASDELKMAVINKYGEFIIPPKFANINFDEEENVLYAENYGSDNKYSLSLNSK